MVSLATVGGKISAALYNQIANFITSPGYFKGTFTTTTSIPATTLWGKTGSSTFTTVTDPLGGFAAATGLYTCKSAGQYFAYGQLKTNSSGGTVAVQLLKNGVIFYNTGNTPTAAFSSQAFAGTVRLALGDTFSIQTTATYTTQADTPAPIDTNFVVLQQVTL